MVISGVSGLIKRMRCLLLLVHVRVSTTSQYDISAGVVVRDWVSRTDSSHSQHSWHKPTGLSPTRRWGRKGKTRGKRRSKSHYLLVFRTRRKDGELSVEDGLKSYKNRFFVERRPSFVSTPVRRVRQVWGDWRQGTVHPTTSGRGRTDDTRSHREPILNLYLIGSPDWRR